MSAPTLDELTAVLTEARGCDCCAFTEKAEAILGDACPADEDGYVDHSYGDDCVRNFAGLVRRVLAKARELP